MVIKCVTVEHIPGTKNVLSDLFSRLTYLNNETDIRKPKVIIASILAAGPSDKLKNALKNISQLQHQDAKIMKIIENGKRTKYKTFEYRNDTLYKNGNYVVPDPIINELIIETHEIYGHVGAKKAFQILYEAFYYKKLKNKCNQLIKKCNNCQYNKHNQLGYVQLQTITEDYFRNIQLQKTTYRNTENQRKY